MQTMPGERELVAARWARRDVEADVVAALAQPPLDLVEEPRLADAVVAADRQHPRRAPRRRGEHLAHLAELVLAAHEAPEGLGRAAHVLDERRPTRRARRRSPSVIERLEREERLDLPHGAAR